MRDIRTTAAALAAAIILALAAGCSRHADIGGTGLVRLDERVYALIAYGPASSEGLGANSGFVVGDNTVLVIDSRFSYEHARQLLKAIRSVTDLPIGYLVDTHYHPDHVWGNAVFRDEGAVILARPETNIEMERFTPVYKDYYRGRKPDVYEIIKDVEVVPADSLVTEDLDIDLGGITVRVEFAGPAHTAGDLIVRIPSKKIVFTGGLVSNGYHVNMGDQGADFDHWLAVLDRLEASKPEIVVPGQGPAGGPEMIAVQRGYIVDLIGLTVDAIRRGRTLSESILEIKVPGTEGYLQENLLPFNIQAVYRKKGLETVAPAVAMDIPTGFVVSDAAGGTDAGMIQWIVQAEDGYLEMEMRWQPTSRQEIIIEDIYDRVAREESKTESLYDFTTDGSRRIIAGDETAPEAYGRWTYRRGTNMRGGGAWAWTMVLVDGRAYSIRMLTNTGEDREREEANIALMEQVVATLRRR